jgi:tetratricopeptide (TPR) repeat protein
VLGNELKQMYSRGEVRRLLGISERQLRSWERLELTPSQSAFGFSDLVVLRTLVSLRANAVPVSQIRRVVEAMRRRWGGAENPLREFRMLAESGKIVVQLGRNRMEPVSGQLLLDFDQNEMKRLLAFPEVTASDDGEAQKREREAERWFQRGLELEQLAAPVDEVVAAYEKALEFNPNLTVALVNLGTLYFHVRTWTKAERYYQRALQVEPDYPLAHFNLGNLYDERGDRARALEHYLRALQCNPSYADAHYNVALLYQGFGQPLRAIHHWKTYLRLDPNSQWASIAKRQLDLLTRAMVQSARGGSRAGTGDESTRR